jgi:hypothetical protein
MASPFIIRTNTPFTKNTRLRNVQPFVNNAENLISSEDSLSLNEKFKSTLISLVELLTYYADGKFESLQSELTTETYTGMSTTLIKLKNAYNDDYELIRDTAARALKGVQRATLQYSALSTTEAHNEVLADRAAILDDRDRLREYIEALNKRSSSSIFGDHTITTSTAAVIPPEYLVYIQLFGFPEDGVFDPDKLGRASNQARGGFINRPGAPTPGAPTPDAPTPDAPNPDAPNPDAPNPGDDSNNDGQDEQDVVIPPPP